MSTSSHAGIGAVDLVEDDDGRELGFKRLLQHVAGLRKRAFAGVDEEHDAVDHAQGALDFAAEIAVAGGIDNVDLDVVIKEGGVLGENGDAAFALEVVGVHDALDDFLVGAENAALMEHGVDQGGLAVVNVSDDGDVANIGSHDSECAFRQK